VAEYAYHFHDLVSGTPLETMPCERVSYGFEIGAPGRFSGSIPVGVDAVDPETVRAATRAARTALWVERDGALVYGGIIWGRRYDQPSGSVLIEAEGPLSFLGRRILSTSVFRGVDQFVIAADFIAHGADVALGVDYDALSGRVRDRSYAVSDAKLALEALTELSQVIDGFEFVEQIAWVAPDVPGWSVRLGYPSVGRRGTSSPLVLEYPGNVSTWDDAEDGKWLAVRGWGLTTTEDGVVKYATKVDVDLIDGGYPVLDMVETYDGITAMASLREHVDRLVETHAGVARTMSVTVDVGGDDELAPGAWSVGDDAWLRITDPRWYSASPGLPGPGLSEYRRVVAANVSLESGGGEKITFTLADVLGLP